MTANPFEDLSDRLDTLTTLIQGISDRLGVVAQAASPAHARTWYNVAEAAEQMGKAVFTVREWCRLGRLAADRRSGSGKGQGWMISAAEIERYRNDGLRPANPPEPSGHFGRRRRSNGIV